MSDQRMNAAGEGTQPDSGSNPNDQMTLSALGGGGRSAPEGGGSQPAGPNDSEVDVTLEAHRKGQDNSKGARS